MAHMVSRIEQTTLEAVALCMTEYATRAVAWSKVVHTATASHKSHRAD
jgi:hypothetical protein